ncbi:hypothetical protein MJN85_31430 [Salmonella enterica subsp. enterica serovar Anatum]|nr:hypothetical protein [Salmonella enterica subsp. enterica serovar Anatum]
MTETLNERQARVLSLAELKDKLDEMEGVQFKQFNSITPRATTPGIMRGVTLASI